MVDRHQQYIEPEHQAKLNRSYSGLWKGLAAAALISIAAYGVYKYDGNGTETNVNVYTGDNSHIEHLDVDIHTGCCGKEATVKYAPGVEDTTKSKKPDVPRGRGSSGPSKKITQDENLESKLDSTDIVNKLREVVPQSNYQTPKAIYQTGDATFNCN